MLLPETGASDCVVMGAIAILPLLQMAAPFIGKLLGNRSKQKAEDRGARTEFDLFNNMNYNRAMQDRAGQANQQALQFADARQGAESARMRQLGSVDMLSGMKPPTDPRARFDTGGRMSPEHLALVRERAMKALESGSDVPQMQTMPAYRETQMAQPSKGDRVLDMLGMGANLWGGLKEAGLFGGQRPFDDDPWRD